MPILQTRSVKVLQNTIILHWIRLVYIFIRHSLCVFICNFVAPLVFYKRFLAIVALAFFFGSNIFVYADTISIECAKQIIKPLVHDKEVLLVKSTDVYYIFTTASNNSFVIVSNDDQLDNPVLGYSESCGWVEDNMPPVLLAWLKSLERIPPIQSSRPSNLAYERADNEIKESIPILLTSRWHQDSPYNDMCPIIADGNVKTAAGCVAIAAAQVAYYWRKDNPLTTSEDTPTYPYGKAPVTYSVPAGTEFQWNLMRDYYTLYEPDDEKEAVARLAYIIGTSAYLQYGVSTGGHVNDIINPFLKQFRLNAKYAVKRDYAQEEWEQLIYNNLKKKQPVVYAGSTGDYGHVVVIDGYDADLNLFHFNFGWGGSGDGYYTINDVSGMNGYTIGQSCVYDIYPCERNISITLNAIGSLYMGIQGQIEISISNSSTVNVDGLYLFVSKNSAYPNNIDKPIWHYNDKIRNDDNRYVFTVQYTPEFFGTNYLILTDRDMNVLAQESISIQEGSSGINEISNEIKPFETYYSLKGEVLPQKLNSGIHIRKLSDHMIIKEYRNINK